MNKLYIGAAIIVALFIGLVAVQNNTETVIENEEEMHEENGYLEDGTEHTSEESEEAGHADEAMEDEDADAEDEVPMSEVEEGTYKADTNESQVEYSGTKIIGHGHTGTVDLKSGFVTFDGKTFTEGEFVIDMTTIAEGGQETGFVKHAKSDDFFSVSTYPEATLNIKNVSQVGDGLRVTADLTIKGKTNEIEFPARFVKKTKNTMRVTADFVIDRTKWGVNYGSNTIFDNLGDAAIKNEIEFSVDLLLKK